MPKHLWASISRGAYMLLKCPRWLWSSGRHEKLIEISFFLSNHWKIRHATFHGYSHEAERSSAVLPMWGHENMHSTQDYQLQCYSLDKHHYCQAGAQFTEMLGVIFFSNHLLQRSKTCGLIAFPWGSFPSPWYLLGRYWVREEFLGPWVREKQNCKPSKNVVSSSYFSVCLMTCPIHQEKGETILSSPHGSQTGSGWRHIKYTCLWFL